MRFPHPSKTLLALAACALFAAPALQAGVEYPAGGNLDPEEGTVEMWVTPMAEELYPPDDGNYHSVFSLFSAKVPGEWNVSCGWYRHGSQIGIKASMNSPKVPKGLTAVLPSSPPPAIEKGKMFHFALTWKGKEFTMFVDGKPSGSKPQAIGIYGPLAGTTLVFGGDGEKTSPLILNAIRVSSYAKNAAELTGAQPVPELETLLFENFARTPANGGEAGTTSPAVAFTLGEPSAGHIKGPTHYVTTPTAGLALYPESQ